jgi:hypothetical protein
MEAIDQLKQDVREGRIELAIKRLSRREKESLVRAAGLTKWRVVQAGAAM